jgi:membrane-associated protein
MSLVTPSTTTLAVNVLDAHSVLATFGVLGVFVVLFAETGLLLGFFLPGDSLLFTAGYLASQKVDGQPIFDLPTLILVLLVAAIAGVSSGYWTGEKFGRRLFTNEQSFWRNPKRLDAAHVVYEKHGGKALVLARFIPAVRTFVPIAAGMARMSYRKFLFWNIIGGLGWVVGMTAGGYYLTALVAAAMGVDEKDVNIDKILLPIVVIIIVISVLPAIWHMYSENREMVHREVGRRLGRRPATQPE